VRVIGEFSTTQGKVEQATQKAEEKLTTLTAHGVEEIAEIKETIIKEVEVAKGTS